eukprot:1839598-Ditylum_brightwellii.AAC.1
MKKEGCSRSGPLLWNDKIDNINCTKNTALQSLKRIASDLDIIEFYQDKHVFSWKRCLDVASDETAEVLEVLGLGIARSSFLDCSPLLQNLPNLDILNIASDRKKNLRSNHRLRLKSSSVQTIDFE